MHPNADALNAEGATKKSLIYGAVIIGSIVGVVNILGAGVNVAQS